MGKVSTAKPDNITKVIIEIAEIKDGAGLRMDIEGEPKNVMSQIYLGLILRTVPKQLKKLYEFMERDPKLSAEHAFNALENLSKLSKEKGGIDLLEVEI